MATTLKKMTADMFNRQYPVGTKIKYYPIVRLKDDYKTGVTTTPAWDMNSNTPLVTTDIMSGGLLLSHIEVID